MPRTRPSDPRFGWLARAASALCLSAAIAAPRALAQAVPVPIRTLTSPAEQSGSTSQPAEFTRVGTWIYFVAQDDANGRELWKTDGTPENTSLVRDIWPGNSAALGPRSLMELNGSLLFVASDGAHGLELWKTDGTPGGTMMLADIEPGPIGSEPRLFVRSAQEVFFQATRSQVTPGFWRTDGTSAGTYRVVFDGACCFSDGQCALMSPEACRAAGGWVRGPLSTCESTPCPVSAQFVCCLPDARCEFRFQSSCLADNGVLMPPGSACLPSPCGEPPPAACCLADHSCIIATAVDCTAANGSPRQAHAACDPNPCLCLAAPCCLPNSTCQILSADACASSGGTVRGSSASCFPSPCALTPSVCTDRFARCCLPDGSCVLAQDAASCTAYRGTFNGTNITCEGAPTPCARPTVACCRPTGACQLDYLESCLASGGLPLNFGNGPCAPVQCPAPDPLAGEIGPPIGQSGNTVFLYDGRDGSPGHGLWAWTPGSDATRLRDFLTSPTFARSLNGRLLFLANDGSSGLEWWTSDGTPAGTTLVADINPGPAGSVSSTYPDSADAPKPGQNATFFFANDGSHGLQLWRTNGAAAGTTRLTTLPNLGSSSSGPITPFADSAVFFAAPSSITFTGLFGLNPAATEGCTLLTSTTLSRSISAVAAADRVFLGYRSLWITDGTPAGTHFELAIPHSSGTDVSPTSLAWIPELGRLFMNANEPWVSDGTAAGSHLLKDIATGVWSRPLRPVGGERLFFSAFEPGAGYEPFVSDGTTAGTLMLRDVNPGAANSNPQNLTQVQRTGQPTLTFFTADSPGYTQFLWVTDGTSSGTRQIGNPNYASFRQGISAAAVQRDGDQFYCRGSIPGSGTELFRTDGTAAGTYMVKDLIPGSASGCEPSAFAGAFTGGVLCFLGTQGLYRTDGTAAGTYLLKAHVPIDNQASVKSPVAFRGLVYFTVSGILWSTDGTIAGTQPIDPAATLPFAAENMIVSGDRLYYRATDGGFSNAHGFELWSSTGLPGGTAMVADLSPGPSSSNPGALQAFQNQAVFFADTPTGRRVYRSDGTASGTVPLLNQSVFPYLPTSLYTWNNLLFMQASSGLWTLAAVDQSPVEIVHVATGMLEPTPLGNSLAFIRQTSFTDQNRIWITDGTPQNTQELVASIQYGNVSYQPSKLVPVGSDLFFVGRGDRGPEWYRTDLVSPVATLALDLTPGAADGDLVPMGAIGSDLLFTSSQSLDGGSFYRFSLSSGLTRIGFGDRAIPPIRMESPVASGGKLFFTSANSSCCPETQLFESDGTDNGTRLIADFSATPTSSDYGVLPGADLNGQLIFSARRTQTGEELYALHPTLGPTLLADRNPGPGESTPHGFARVDQRLFYAARLSSASSGSELCVTDGTPAGTLIAAQIGPVNASSNPRYITDLGGIALFVATDATHGSELWRSDGTAPGTWLVKDIVPGSLDPGITGLVRMGDYIYFAATTPGHGRELWRSDGTESGTTIVRDIWLGAEGSSPSWLTATGNHLHFVAYTPETGPELWISDGTSAGTFMLFEMAPGPSGSAIEQLVVSGERLYFLATALPQGTSLWTYQWPTLLAFCSGDYNRSGGAPTIQDIFAFLQDWFAAASRADFNGSGQITVQDIFDYLTAYFAGCS